MTSIIDLPDVPIHDLWAIAETRLIMSYMTSLPGTWREPGGPEIFVESMTIPAIADLLEDLLVVSSADGGQRWVRAPDFLEWMNAWIIRFQDEIKRRAL